MKEIALDQDAPPCSCSAKETQNERASINENEMPASLKKKEEIDKKEQYCPDTSHSSVSQCSGDGMRQRVGKDRKEENPPSVYSSLIRNSELILP